MTEAPTNAFPVAADAGTTNVQIEITGC